MDNGFKRLKFDVIRRGVTCLKETCQKKNSESKYFHTNQDEKGEKRIGPNQKEKGTSVRVLGETKGDIRQGGHN